MEKVLCRVKKTGDSQEAEVRGRAEEDNDTPGRDKDERGRRQEVGVSVVAASRRSIASVLCTARAPAPAGPRPVSLVSPLIGSRDRVLRNPVSVRMLADAGT